jgi:hypothetical protein
MSPTPRILLLSCMKNEGATVLEWFAYHRLIGVDHFLIYTNDCQDGTDRIWMRLEELGHATHRVNRILRRAPGVKPQQRALIRVLADPVYLASDWVLFLDADEFLNIHAGDGRIDALMAQNPQADCFFVNWRLFGTSNVANWAPDLVTARFTHACDPARAPDRFATSPKALFRRDRFAKPGIHRPTAPPEGEERLHVLPSGQPVPRNWRTLLQAAEYSHAQVNHYSVQSLDGVMMKFARGFALNTAMPDPAAYLKSRDTNHVEDRTIQRHLPRLRAEVAKLLQDPVLATLQAEAEAWRRRQIRRALKQPQNRAVMDSLTAALSPLPQSAMDQPSG